MPAALLLVIRLFELTPTTLKGCSFCSIYLSSSQWGKKEKEKLHSWEYSEPKNIQECTRGNSHQHEVNKHPNYWLHAAHRTPGNSANSFLLRHWTADSMLYLASSVLMNNALISTVASILEELGSQMSSGPPIVWTLGLWQALLKIWQGKHCRVGNATTSSNFGKKTARIVTSRREHVMLMEYSLPIAVSDLVLYVRFVGNIIQVHKYTIKGFWGRIIVQGLKSMWLQIGHHDKQMESVPTTTEFRQRLWQIWVSP